MELEGVRKENQGKSTSVPWRNFTPGSCRGQHRFPRQEPPESQTGKVGRDWHLRQDTRLEQRFDGDW